MHLYYYARKSTPHYLCKGDAALHDLHREDGAEEHAERAQLKRSTEAHVQRAHLKKSTKVMRRRGVHSVRTHDLFVCLQACTNACTLRACPQVRAFLRLEFSACRHFRPSVRSRSLFCYIEARVLGVVSSSTELVSFLRPRQG